MKKAIYVECLRCGRKTKIPKTEGETKVTTDPIKEAQLGLALLDEALKKAHDLRNYLSIMASTQIPKGYEPYKMEVQAPMFENVKSKGREALKATVVTEIMCLKDNDNPQA